MVQMILARRGIGVESMLVFPLLEKDDIQYKSSADFSTRVEDVGGKKIKSPAQAKRGLEWGTHHS